MEVVLRSLDAATIAISLLDWPTPQRCARYGLVQQSVLKSAGYGFLVLGIRTLSSEGQSVSIKPGELRFPNPKGHISFTG